MTNADRVVWLMVFLAWLFGSVLFGYIVDKLTTKKRRHVCGHRQKRQKQLSRLNYNTRRKQVSR